jgi:hypothetical protein
LLLFGFSGGDELGGYAIGDETEYILTVGIDDAVDQCQSLRICRELDYSASLVYTSESASSQSS